MLMTFLISGIFGCVIHDTALIRKGIRHEVWALLICILLGLVLGLIISPLSQIYGCPQYPTPGNRNIKVQGFVFKVYFTQ